MWAASAAGLLAHLSFVAVLGAEAVFLGVLAIARQSPAARLLLPLSVPLAVLVALAVVDLRHLQLGGGPALVAGSLVSDLGALSAGAPLGTPWTGWLALVGGAGVLLLIGMRLRIPADGPSGAGRFVGVFYAVMILLPVATAISTNPPFLFPRYFLVSLAFVPLLLAGTLPRLPVSLIRAVVVAVIVLNAASWTLFWRDGRGGYATALSSMLAAVPEGTVTVASDHEFRTQLVLDFYRRLLGPNARRLAYVSTDAEFTIVTHVATPIAADTCGECRLFRDEPSSPLSGSRWRIYRRSP
jgi:hypothetical protein